MVREAESQSVPVEAVLGKAMADGGGAKAAVLRARAALGAELRTLMTSSGSDASGPALKEAAAAWIQARGSPALALQRMMGERRRKLRTLLSLGVPRSAAEPALHHVGWSLSRALPEVQRRKLRPFLSRVWDHEEPPMDFGNGDQQVLARRALATLSLPSWGRAVLLVAMGRELGLSPGPAAAPGLQELVEAVRSCPDRALIRRRLRCDCAVCGWALPREQMRWLTGCECALCPECFRQHFTIGVKEKAVADLVCPACGRPDLRDEAARLCYFSTLDVQLRQELDPNTYQLFTQKLTERELLRDPQFLWCPQCSFGFIFEAERGPAQCPQCQQCCCPRCLRPWHPEHGSLSCSEFGLWLQERDPQVERVGLEAFLREHGIACPRCSQWFALARGGCLHFQCSQCAHQFCGGCGAPFHPRERCPLPRCSLRPSLHAHHPRHCAFHLRDWEPRRLQRLLQVGGVPYDTQPPSGAQLPPGGGCWLQELKETPGAPPRDAACGRPTAVGQAGLCRAHYAEYLVRLINERGLDPAALYGAAELRAAAERHLPAGRPPQGDAESDAEYAVRLRELLAREAPVEPRPSRPSPKIGRAHV